jgi:hypothetical protein
MSLNIANLEEALTVLGKVLEDRNQRFEVVVVGGGGLLLLGQIDRTTRDIDLVARMEEGRLVSTDPLPPALTKAAEEVGVALELGKGWFNIGPASLLDLGLPDGFIDRLHIRQFGSLTVYLADRFDQIFFKLYAAVDQGHRSKHFADLVRLKPSRKELQQAKKWCTTHDVSTPFAKEIDHAIEEVLNART